jgi:leader peptidase (prepilin peptidase)/N-methyltransferase
MIDEGSAWTAFGFVLGASAGAAVAAHRRGASFVAGRRCPKCGASLSPWAALPSLSWVAVRARCRGCGRPAPLLPAVLEAGVAVTGVAAILLLPPRNAVIAAGAGWMALLGLLVWRRR